MMNKYMALAPTKKLLPNWALAGVLSTLVGASYFYSIRAVGDDSAQVLHCRAPFPSKFDPLYLRLPSFSPVRACRCPCNPRKPVVEPEEFRQRDIVLACLNVEGIGSQKLLYLPEVHGVLFTCHGKNSDCEIYVATCIASI